MRLHELAVGQPYHPSRRRWPEAVDYNYRQGGHELLLFWRSLSPEVVEAVRRGRMDLALYVEQPLIVLLYRIEGACDWSDQPYSWHLVPQEQRTLPDPEPLPDARTLLTVILVDADTGVVRALRAVTLSPAMSAMLDTAIRVQAAGPWDGSEAWRERIGRLYRRFATAEAMLPHAAIRSRGGE